MNNTQCILTLVCTLAFAGCSETTKESQPSAPQAPASSLGTSPAQRVEPVMEVPDVISPIEMHEPAIAAIVVEPEPIIVVAPAPIVEVIEVVEPEPVIVEVVEPEPEVVVETPAPEYVFPPKTPRNLQQRFRDNDVDQDGYLSLEEFTSYLSVWLAQNQPHRDAKTWAPGPFKKKDTNGDGKLSPAEAFGQ
ncbi:MULTISPECIES: EF-hand domain-containing protein [unclassified Lentimonas]|nr:MULTISPECIES: EF-hand domain-containing protein [unclassified Lentimonas]